MKYIKTVILLFILFLTVCLTSCKKPTQQTPHTHEYVEGVCSCGEKDPNYKPVEEKTYVRWRFTIDETIVLDVQAEEGVTPEYPSAPENADENYRWLKLDSIVDGQLCYDVILLYEVKICKITFVDQYDNVLKK